MFSLFKKKDGKVTATDFVFINQSAKWTAILRAANEQPPIFVAWFDDSLEQLQSFFNEHKPGAEVLSFRQLHSGLVDGKPVIFIEHYPLAQKEQEIFDRLSGSKIWVYSALDDALFKAFGGERIAGMMKSMRMEENEAVSHKMITGSIVKAQEKLASLVTIEQTANNMSEWMQKNIGNKL